MTLPLRASRQLLRKKAAIRLLFSDSERLLNAVTERFAHFPSPESEDILSRQRERQGDDSVTKRYVRGIARAFHLEQLRSILARTRTGVASLRLPVETQATPG